jgi:hypothetical protein
MSSRHRAKVIIVIRSHDIMHMFDQEILTVNMFAVPLAGAGTKLLVMLHTRLHVCYKFVVINRFDFELVLRALRLFHLGGTTANERNWLSHNR